MSVRHNRLKGVQRDRIAMFRRSQLFLDRGDSHHPVVNVLLVLARLVGPDSPRIERQGARDDLQAVGEPVLHFLHLNVGSGVVGYNVQAAVETEHHLIVAHEVITIGNDHAQLAAMSAKTREALGSEALEVVADRGYFDSEEMLACDRAGVTVTLPKPQTSGAKATGRFGKQDFRYVADGDVYICPAGNRLTYRYTR